MLFDKKLHIKHHYAGKCFVQGNLNLLEIREEIIFSEFPPFFG